MSTLTYNQPVADPLARFKAIPWCAKLLEDKSVVGIMVPDRTPLPSTESHLVRTTLNTPETTNACVTFFRMPGRDERQGNVGETIEKPFLEINALLEVGDGLAGRPHIMHGGIFSVILDEVLSTIAYQQGGGSILYEDVVRNATDRSRESEHGAITAYLNVAWKKPLFTPSVTLCRGRVLKKEGRKVFVKGSFHDSEGSMLAEAEGLWILLAGKAKL